MSYFQNLNDIDMILLKYCDIDVDMIQTSFETESTTFQQGRFHVAAAI